VGEVLWVWEVPEVGLGAPPWEKGGGREYDGGSLEGVGDGERGACFAETDLVGEDGAAVTLDGVEELGSPVALKGGEGLGEGGLECGGREEDIGETCEHGG
jgi:hypothetical protein